MLTYYLTEFTIDAHAFSLHATAILTSAFCLNTDVPCDNPIAFDQSALGAYVSGQQHFGSVVTYTCNTGYHVSPGVYEYTSHCDMFGEWNVTDELCEG